MSVCRLTEKYVELYTCKFFSLLRRFCLEQPCGCKQSQFHVFGYLPDMSLLQF